MVIKKNSSTKVTRYVLVMLVLVWTDGALTPCCTRDDDSLALRTAKVETKLTDSELEAAIQAQFDRDQSFSQIKFIVDTENESVILFGSVELEAQRTHAVELARNGNAALLITDLIKVRPLEK